jgi:DNA-binding response OmpR family regulator
VRILLVDRDSLGIALEPSGFEVTVVSSMDDKAIENVAVFAGIVLGTQESLEERVGRCRGLRDEGYVGAILAACADVTEGEALTDAGADDFVTAPFEARELATRIRACARRTAAYSSPRWGPLELDRVHRVLLLRGRSIPLTAREWELLVCLIEAGGRVVSRDVLRARMLHGRADKGSNLVEVHLSRLRDKLGGEAALIETVRRSGYRLRR